MTIGDCINQLAQQGRAIQQLAAAITPEQANWQPDPKTWSLANVMDHMVREERRDFRRRLAAGLGLPDPGRVQVAGPYAPDDLAAIVAAFAAEREHSLAWLRELDALDWDAQCKIPRAQISAGDMLAAWAAHDLLHMRQLIELHFAYTVHHAQPYRVNYAGKW